MTKENNFYITTPIYYVNDKPHIGHAYTTLACDVLARFKRLDDYRVYFLTGTDEHGQKIEKTASSLGVSPKDLADKNSDNFRNLSKILNCQNDDFIRTTEARHIHAVQVLWQELEKRGDIYLGEYAGWYSVRDEAFFSEDELQLGTDGEKIAPTGAPVEWVKESSYFFKLSGFQDRLLKFYEDNPDFIAPNSRRNEVISFVKSGLQDLSISRTSFNWGIPVPDDENHVVYVWLDALTNYLSALGYPEKTGNYKEFWPASLHMVGKDILRFHAVFWPAFLMSAELPLPKRIFAHGWWTNEGEKISKSLGNVIDPLELIKTYGLDQMRFFLMREVPFGNDGDFNHRGMIGRINSELANDFGNLVQRVLSMIFKNCDEKLPNQGSLTDSDEDMLIMSYGLLDKMRHAMDKQMFHEALEQIWLVIRAANAYVDHQAPWALKKTDPDRMVTVLWVLAEVIRNITILIQPFMPESASNILDQISVDQSARSFKFLGAENALTGGVEITKPQGVFPRFIEENQ